MTSKLYENRHVGHKYMAPTDFCGTCSGRGWHYEIVPGTENDWIPESRERYCECEAGQLRQKLECAT